MSQSPCETPLPVAVVIPCYKARRHIAEVLAGLAGRVRHIYVVDDCCTEQTGRFVQEIWKDANVSVVFLTENQGVGGAVLAGYREALKDGHEIVVKMDGDNQMDPVYLPALIAPLVQGEADYAKGNRFFDVYSLGAMPVIRLLGNASLSFIVKMASGYWDIMDPTNGYTAIHCVALQRLPLDRLDKRYFFECDMLAQLSQSARRADGSDPRPNRHRRSVAESNRPELPERRSAAAALFRSERQDQARGLGREKAQRQSRGPGIPAGPAGPYRRTADGAVRQPVGGCAQLRRPDRNPGGRRA
jgi:hypothetical protein